MMTTVADVVLADPDGTTVRLGPLLDRPTIVVRVRYFG
jgi:hypothetical protein